VGLDLDHPAAVPLATLADDAFVRAEPVRPHVLDELVGQLAAGDDAGDAQAAEVLDELIGGDEACRRQPLPR
jgi:hypothetical protein